MIRSGNYLYQLQKFTVKCDSRNEEPFLLHVVVAIIVVVIVVGKCNQRFLPIVCANGKIKCSLFDRRME